MKEGQSLSVDELHQFSRAKIVQYKVPRDAKFVDACPMTRHWKVQKFRMREIMIDELGRHAAAAIKTA